MSKTAIEWATHVWNPVRGCTKVSRGCDNCYAMRHAYRFSGKGQPYENLTRIINGRPQWTAEVRCAPEMLDQPLRWRKPRRVFVNSMGDLFHEDVPYEFVDHVFAVMALAPQHTFQILTKRPERMLRYFTHHFTRHKCGAAAAFYTGNLSPDYSPDHGCELSVCNMSFPLPNVWLGVSVEDQATADERIPLLLQTPAAVRWVSAEPLLGPINLWHQLGSLAFTQADPWATGRAIDWLVVGGESGPNARPMNPEWARSLRDQCIAAGVPYFFKQWGEWAPVDDYPSEIQESYDVRGLTQDKSMRMGKKSAGRHLNGRTWDEYPMNILGR